MAVLNQNLSNYSTQDFEPIPPGEYDFEINDTDVVDTKTGKRMVKVSCRVIGPTHAGRIVFENFVLGNDIAMSRLKTLATMCGHPRPDYIQDTQELHGLRFRGNVGIRESEGYAPQNQIKSFKKIPAPPSVGTAPAAVPQIPQPAASFPSVPPAPSLPPMMPPKAMMQPPLAAPPAQPAAPKPSAPWVK